MNKVIIVSDNEVLIDVISINFKMYLNLEAIVVKEASQIEKKIDEFRPALVFTQSKINGEDVALLVFEEIEKSSLESKMIVFGQESSISKNESVHCLSPVFNIKFILKTAAYLLGVDGKQMASIEVPKLVSFPAKLFKHIDIVDVPCFIKVGSDGENDEYSQIWESGENVKAKVDHYLKANVIEFYIKSEDRLKIVNLLSLSMKNLLLDAKTADEEITATDTAFSFLGMEYLNNKEVSRDIIDISNKCMNTITQTTKKLSSLESLVKSLLDNKAGYVYSHTILATFVSDYIVKNISWGGHGHSEKLSFVFFFHDILLVPLFDKYPDYISEEELLFDQNINDTDKELLLQHAQMAGELVKNFPHPPIGSDVIVTQHHGVPSGAGLTTNFSDNISPLSKVMLISESFVQLFFQSAKEGIKPDYHEIYEKLSEKFPKHTYKKIIEVLRQLEI